MALEFCSIASGSSGNCYLVKDDNTNILIDAGIAGKRIIDRLCERDVAMEEIDGIFLTHEHSDHIQSIKKISRCAVNAKVYASEGTLSCVGDKVASEKAVRVTANQEIEIGNLTVCPFSLSHDASEPLGYTIRSEQKQLTIITDTGFVTDEIREQAETADTLILEANHEVNILRMGSYPYPLKRRILGEEGHLSNEAAGELICHVLKRRKSKKPLQVALAHLSKENNTPQQAYLTIRNILFEDDYYIDKDVVMCVVPRDDASVYMEV